MERQKVRRLLTRPGLVALGVFLILVFAPFAAVALAQQQGNGQGSPGGNSPAIVYNGDTFPASLGYAALGIFSAAGTIMSGVIAKLWYGAIDDRKASQAAIDAAKKEAEDRLQAYKNYMEAERTADSKACAAEVSALRDRLEKEMSARLTEQERLLREQKEILREVMVTCGQITTALAQNTEALKKLTAAA